MKTSKYLIATAGVLMGAGAAFADSHANIVEAAQASEDHQTLVAAVQQADLVETLSGEGPFTVFAPTDAAFEALPDGTVDTLMMDENTDQLSQILTCHVVAAEVMSDALVGMIEDDGGTHAVDTVGGCTLQASLDGDMVVIEDENGGTATVTAADLAASNGVIHVIDSVLLPAQ